MIYDGSESQVNRISEKSKQTQGEKCKQVWSSSVSRYLRQEGVDSWMCFKVCRRFSRQERTGVSQAPNRHTHMHSDREKDGMGTNTRQKGDENNRKHNEGGRE